MKSLWEQSKEREITYGEIPTEAFDFIKSVDYDLKDRISGTKTKIFKDAPICYDGGRCDTCIFEDEEEGCRSVDNHRKYKWLKAIKDKHEVENG